MHWLENRFEALAAGSRTRIASVVRTHAESRRRHSTHPSS